MENINPTAAAAVDNLNTTNTNGVPGSVQGETPAQTQARLYKVKIDGVETEVDEAELLKGYGHNAAASKRMNEAATLRKETEQLLRAMQADPEQAMRALGLDPRKFSEDIINRELAEAMLSPQERELREYKAKVEKYAEQERTAKERWDKEQMDQQIQKQAESIQSDIIDSLEGAGLPKTERTVSRIIYYMQAALQAGFNVSPKDVMQQVKDDYKADFKALIGGLSEDQIEMMLGNDMVRKMAKASVVKGKVGTVDKEVNKLIKSEAAKKIRSPADFFSHRDGGY